MTTILTVSFALMGLAALLTVGRLLAGPSSFDRLLASDTLVVVATAFLAVYSTTAGGALYIDVAIVYAVIGFIGVVTIARFLQGVQ